MEQTFDPTEWAEKRKLAMVKASELRQQRRSKAAAAQGPTVIRAESRDSVDTRSSGWKWEVQPLELNRRVVKRDVVASSRVRAVTSPVEKRRVNNRAAPANKRVVVFPTRTARPADPVTRQMIDRDTLRLENRTLFVKAIHYWRSKHSGVGNSNSSFSSSRVSVFVRKRPLFDKEAVAKEFDTVSVLAPNAIVTHNCLFQADLKTPFLTHSRFFFSKCFDEHATNEIVFSTAAQPLVELARHGGSATIFCFGQTGSGKTHTMTAIEEMTSSFLGPEEIGIEFIELCGKKVFDLLAAGEEKTAVKLREAADGSLALEGATQMVCLASAELTLVMENAHKRRNTESTGANQVSSRSHAVCILSVKSSRGKLLLVDLAGSERRKDSMWHDKERQREGAEINASIHALKECIRMQKSKNSIIPFRLSTLTRILAETFTNPQARLAVIATVSPCATDVEHTVSTLKTVHQLALDPVPIAETKQTEMYPRDAEKRNSQHPKKWTAHQVAQWLEKEGETSLAGIPKSTTGAMLVRMPESRFVQACGGDERRGAKLYRSLHVLMQELRDLKNST